MLLQGTRTGNPGFWTRDHEAGCIELGHARSDTKTGAVPRAITERNLAQPSEAAKRLRVP